MLRRAASLFVFLSASTALAQTGQGTIVGRITDPTGGVVPGVSVRVEHAGTGFTYDSVTNEEGLYHVPYLNPGTYTLTFEAPGFKRLVRSGIAVRSTETSRVDVALELGQVSESVEVKAASVLLETESATVGHLVSGESLNRLPTPQQKIQSILW